MLPQIVIVSHFRPEKKMKVEAEVSAIMTLAPIFASSPRTFPYKVSYTYQLDIY